MNIELLASRLRLSAAAEDEQGWPDAGLQVLRDAGCLKQVVPAEYGGIGADPPVQLGTYEAIAAECVALALILTQHDAAVEILAASDQESVAGELLEKCVRGEELLTVGISQVTTSRRHGRAAMQAVRDDQGFVLDGVMPWVTGAQRADHIVTAAVLEDDRQLLASVPTDAPGLAIGDPMPLLALQSSWTSEVRCQALAVPRSAVLRGPMQAVLERRAPVKGLTVSSVGIGMAGALLREVRQLADKLPGADRLLSDTIEPRFDAIRRRLFDAARVVHEADVESPAVAIRAEVNGIITRLAATLMTLAKGTGFLLTRPTQRLVREAAFFLVWSAAPPVQLATLARIWDVSLDDPDALD